MKAKFDFKLNNHSLKILITYFSVISALELMAYGVGGFFSCVAAYLWLFTGCFWLGYFLFFIGAQTAKDIKQKNIKILGPFLGLLILFIFFLGNINFSDINPDAAQQVSAGLNNFLKPDLGYTETAFLGYPSRQYIIAAIPALIFGRNIWTLHAGFGFMFLIGLTVLFINLRSWLKKNGQKEEFALLPCFALLAFPFITEYYMNFEQAITPVALTMLAIGLFLRLLLDPDMISILALSYVGCLMADSYTPVLATLGLLLVFLCIYAIDSIRNRSFFFPKIPSPAKNADSAKTNSDKTNLSSETSETAINVSYENKHLHKTYVGYACIGCAVNILAFFIATYISGRSDRITEFREETSALKSALGAFKDFFTDANVRFLGLFGGAIILYMLLSLTGRLLICDGLVSLWVLGVVFFSDYMTGYTAYDKAWLMQRNMIVIPVLLTCIFLWIMHFIKKHGLTVPKPVLYIFLIFFFGAGLFNFSQPHKSFKYFSYIQPMKYAIDYISDTLKENGLKATDEFCIIIYTDNILESNIYDYASFFFPNATTYSESGYEYDDDIDTSKVCMFFAEDDRLMALDPGMEGSDGYTTFLRTPMDSRTSYNIRYDSNVTWYRKVMRP